MSVAAILSMTSARRLREASASINRRSASAVVRRSSHMRMGTPASGPIRRANEREACARGPTDPSRPIGRPMTRPATLCSRTSATRRSASALNLVRRMVSRPLAIVRERSESASPNVFVPTSMPISRAARGSVAAKASTSRISARSISAFTQASAAGGLSLVIRALYLHFNRCDRPLAIASRPVSRSRSAGGLRNHHTSRNPTKRPDGPPSKE